MKTAYILGSFPSLSETFIQREVTALRAKGEEIILFALAKGRPPFHPGTETRRSDVYYRNRLLSPYLWIRHLRLMAGAPRLYLRILSGIFKKVAAGNLRALRNFMIAGDLAFAAKCREVDHIHAHFAFLPADVGRLMARLMKVPFSFSAHARDIYTQGRKALEDKVAGAAFVTTCTQHGKDYLQNLFPDLTPEKLVMIHHGLPLRDFTPGGAVEPLILAVGRLEEKKGFHHLVESCRILKERGTSFQCRIVGEGSQRQRLLSLIGQYGLEAAIQPTGALTQDEVIALFRRAAVLVAPSIVTGDGDRDGLPNVILEAMAMQVPVIASSVAGIPEAVKDGRNGFLVPEKRPDLLAEKIEQILKDRVLREDMGKHGRITVEKDFDILKNVDRLIQLFHGTAEIHDIQTTSRGSGE